LFSSCHDNSSDDSKTLSSSPESS
ncbi:hypothetical protein A2U01_0113637, partial [Trifolium medium]|nr:hypothetical protein [Trifolium medium]